MKSILLEIDYAGSYLGIMIKTHLSAGIRFGNYLLLQVFKFLSCRFVITLFQQGSFYIIEASIFLLHVNHLMVALNYYPLLIVFPTWCAYLAWMWFSKISCNILESGYHVYLKYHAHYFNEAGIITSIVTWNIWCIRNGFVFKGTQAIVTLTTASVFSQLHISKWAFGDLHLSPSPRPP